jgi:predicted PurR-regulated permease PerM
VYLLLVLVILGAILWAVPLVVEQLQRLVSSLPEIAANVDATMDNLRAQVGLPPEDVPESGQPNLTVVLSGLLNTAVANLAGLVAGAASIVTNMILVLVFALYLNLGGPILGARLVRMLPRGWRDEARLFNRELNRAFGGFLRGQVIYAALSGVIALVVMLVFQTPFAGLAAIATFLLSLIPLLGSFLGIIPPMLAGFLVSTQTGILILVILGGIQLVLTNAIMPKIFGSSIQLEPILVFVAIVVGIRLAGIWGAVFAIPLTALGIAMAQHARRRRAILAASRT